MNTTKEAWIAQQTLNRQATPRYHSTRYYTIRDMTRIVFYGTVAAAVVIGLPFLAGWIESL